MSSLYNGTNSFPTSITIPSDGDSKPATSVNVAIEGIADRTVYLKRFLDGSSSGAALASPTISGTLAGTFSSSAIVTLTGTGHSNIRVRPIVVGDFSLGYYALSSVDGDIFTVASLAAPSAIHMSTVGSTSGHAIEISALGMTGGFTLEIYDSDGIVLLLTVTASSNCYSRWVFTAGAWKCIHSADK